MNRIFTVMLCLLAAAASAAEPGYYLWQRRWTPEVRRAAESVPPERLAILAGELDSGTTVRTAVPAEFSAAEAVFRIHTSRLADFPAVESLVKGVPNRNIQLDSDVPERRLAEYAAFLKKLVSRFPEKRFSVTLLPCHVKNPELRAVLDSGIVSCVLQLHGFEFRSGGSFELMDPETARRAVAGMRRFHFPFRIALPAYAYVVDGGRPYAEGFPSGAVTEKTRLAAPDFRLIAALVRENPDLGVLWFRLPVDGSRWGLDLETVQILSRGEVPVPDAVFSTRPQGGGTLVLLEFRRRIPFRETISFPFAGDSEVIPLNGSRIENGRLTTTAGVCGKKIPVALVLPQRKKP